MAGAPCNKRQEARPCQETQNGRSPRSVALVGPYGSGKSTLFEAMMEAAGAPVNGRRSAQPPDDHRAPPRPLQLSRRRVVDARLPRLDRIRLRDVRGAGRGRSRRRGLRAGAGPGADGRAAAEAAGGPGRAASACSSTRSTRWRAACATRWRRCRPTPKSPLVLRQVPILDGETVTGYVDVVSERAYRYRKGQPSELIQLPSEMQDEEQEALGKLVEVLADHDDALLEKVLEDIKPSTDEIYRDLRKDLAAGSVIEVLLGSADHANGVRRLWKALRHDTPFVAGDRRAQGRSPPDGPPLAQVFKTVHAGHTGKLSYARVWRGTIKDGATLGGTRLGGIYRFAGGEPAKVRRGGAGDVVALGRLEGVATGATVSPGADAGATAVPRAAAAGLFAGDRHHRPQGRRQAVRRAAEAARGGPDAVDDARAGHRRDRAARPGRDAPERDGRPAGERLRAEGDDAQAAGGVQGNDPPGGARAWPVETADRRAWPVRRREDRHRAARARVEASNSSTRSSAARCRATSFRRSARRPRRRRRRGRSAIRWWTSRSRWSMGSSTASTAPTWRSRRRPAWR